MADLFDLKLEADSLYLFVLGPGDGECILLRIPPDSWVLVDCFARPRNAGRVPGLELVDALGGRLVAALLTHPHADHAEGFDRAVVRAEEWVGCLDIWVPSHYGDANTADSVRRLVSGLTEHAVAAIQDRWERHPRTRLSTTAGQCLTVGEATLQVLHPPSEVLSTSPPPNLADANRLSSPMLCKWRGVRVLLGADLPTSDWPAAAGVAFPCSLTDHAALKVPHHGSLDAMAIHEFGEGGGADRTWIVTPKRRKPHPPRYEASQGVHLALQCVERLYLTSCLLPLGGLDLKIAVVRTELERRAASLLKDPVLPGASPSELVVDPRDPYEAWVAVEFTQDGVVRVGRGGASVVVVEDGPDLPGAKSDGAPSEGSGDKGAV